MRKLRTFLFLGLTLAIVGVFGFEALAAVYTRVRIGGTVSYSATEIGAKVWGAYSYRPVSGGTTSDILTFSMPGDVAPVQGVYNVGGNKDYYTDIAANVGHIRLDNLEDQLTFYIFVKNTGDQFIAPLLSIAASDTSHITMTKTEVYFDTDKTADPLQWYQNQSIAAFVGNVARAVPNAETFTSNGDAGLSNPENFGANHFIDNDDVWCAAVTIELKNTIPSDEISSAFSIGLELMANAQYTSNQILSVYQTQNQTDPAWHKYGYNATLNAAATKIESNNLSTLATYLQNADTNGNARKADNTLLAQKDDYLTAYVYRNIDQVNIDIATGEVIGRLSDVNYPFEWYGRDVTLPAGTKLASGRTLEEDETFTVDVYTYYPDMYIRRWVVNNNVQWLSLSEKPFYGAVKIDEYYIGTFEATMFSPITDDNGNVTGYTAAYNEHGLIPRSYVYERSPLTTYENKWLVDNYNYKTDGLTSAQIDEFYNASVDQKKAVEWCANLTKAWEKVDLGEYKKAKGVQGENWHLYVYNLLYLIKYANNNAQAMVGMGNAKTYGIYADTAYINVRNYNNVTLLTSGNTGNNARGEGQKCGATIGVYSGVASEKGSATYARDNLGYYQMSATGYNEAGMNYGYNYRNYKYGDDRQGLFMNQFLTYSDGESRYLLDGYAGSDGYTPVFCLGKANPWGNVWKSIFGQTCVSNGTQAWLFTNFDDYDYNNPNWRFTAPADSYVQRNELTGMGYVQMMGYTLPMKTTSAYYRYLGVHTPTDESVTQKCLSLIGLPASDSGEASDTEGLCDLYVGGIPNTKTYQVAYGGLISDAGRCGPFYLNTAGTALSAEVYIGFRPMLITG